MAWGIGGGATQYESASTNASSITAWCDIGWSSYESYAGYTTSGIIQIDGTNYGYTGPTSINYVPYYPYYGSQSGAVRVGEKNVGWTHDNNTGYRGAKATHVYFYGGGGYAPGDLNYNTPDFGALDYDRSPTIPSISEGTGTARNSAGTTYSATASGSVNNSGTTVTYTLQSSTTTNFASTTDHGSTTTSGGTVSATGLNANTTYYFRIKASNGDGTKYSTDTAPGYKTSYGIPNQPTSVGATPSTTANDRISISWTAPTYTGAGLITGNLTSTGAYTITRSGTPARTFYSNTTSVVDTDTNLVPGNSYTYTVKATSVSNTGSPQYTGSDSIASASKIAPGTPYAPTTVPAVSNVGLNITVVSAAVGGDGGVVINTANANEGYFVQYQLADTLNGTYGYGGTSGAWSPAIKMSTQATRTHVYSSMTPAKYYKFRTYAANTVTKASDDTTNIAYPHNNITYTSGVNFATNTVGYFLAAGGKRFDGTNWIPTQTAKRFDGTNWVPLTIAKRFDGTNWVPLS